MKTQPKKSTSLLTKVQIPAAGALLSVLGFAVMIGGVYVQAMATRTTTQPGCLDETKASSYSTSFTRGTGKITTIGGKALCKEANLVLESFSMPDRWDGHGFNATALPQTKFAVTSFTLPANQTGINKTVAVDVPANCKNTQLDFYFPPAYDKLVGLNDDDPRYIGGMIFGGSGSCVTPTPLPSVTPVPTVTPVATLACTKLAATPVNGSAPLAVSFTGTATASGQTISQYQFDFGDNDAIATASQSASHTYAKPGTYTANLKVKGSNGAFAPEAVACSVKITVAGLTPTPLPTNTPSVAGSSTSMLPQTGIAGPFMTLIGALFLTGGIVHIWFTQRHKLIIVPKKR